MTPSPRATWPDEPAHTPLDRALLPARSPSSRTRRAGAEAGHLTDWHGHRVDVDFHFFEPATPN